MASAVDSRLAYARLSAVATASRLPTATRGSNNSYTTSWDTTAGVRVLSPFDPLLRDRKRTEWLFGFRYRIEIYVPEEKREYGYYVFPLLEGDQLVGRIDMRRREGRLYVRALWPERGVRLGKGAWDISGRRRRAVCARR